MIRKGVKEMNNNDVYVELLEGLIKGLEEKKKEIKEKGFSILKIGSETVQYVDKEGVDKNE